MTSRTAPTSLRPSASPIERTAPNASDVVNSTVTDAEANVINASRAVRVGPSILAANTETTNVYASGTVRPTMLQAPPEMTARPVIVSGCTTDGSDADSTVLIGRGAIPPPGGGVGAEQWVVLSRWGWASFVSVAPSSVSLRSCTLNATATAPVAGDTPRPAATTQDAVPVRARFERSTGSPRRPAAGGPGGG